MPGGERWVFEALEEAFVPEAAELLVHVLVPEGQGGEVRLEDHLVAGLRLESDAEQEVVEHFLVRVRGVRALGLADKVEVQVRVDRRRVIDRARRRAAKVPDDAPGVRDEAGLAEGEWFWAGGEDFIENLVV